MPTTKRLSLILIFSVAGFGFLSTPFAQAVNLDFNFANLFSAITKSESFSLIKGFTENGNVNIPRLEPSPIKISPAKPSPTPVPVPRPEPQQNEESLITDNLSTPTPPPTSTPAPIIKQTVIREIIAAPSQPAVNTLALISSLESKLNQSVSSLESKIQNLQRTAPTILQIPSSNTGSSTGNTITNSTTVRSETLTLTNDGTIDGSLTVKKSITIGTSTIFIDGDNNKLGIGDSSPETNFEVVGTASISGAVTLGSTITLSGHTSLTTASISGNF